MLAQLAQALGWFNNQPAGTQTIVGVLFTALLGALGLGLLGLIRLGAKAISRWLAARKHVVQLEISSCILTRLYGRHPDAASGFVYIEFQELFYEWQLTFAAQTEIQKIAIAITNIRADDRVKTSPGSATQSEKKPKWVPGFEEPGRRPDFYALTVTFDNLVAGQRSEITVRRPLINPVVPDDAVIQVSEVQAMSARVVLPTYDVSREAKRLTMQASKWADRLWPFEGETRPRHLPIGLNPGDPMHGEIDTTIDAKWSTEDLSRYTACNLMVRRGVT